MDCWPSEIPLGPKCLSSKCTSGLVQADAVVLETSSVPSARKVKILFPTDPPR